MTFEQAYAFADAEIGIVQKREEIQWLFERVRAARPRTVLEIGLDFGGTSFLWSRAAAPDAHLLAIDIKPVGRFGDWSPFSIVRRGFAVGSQRVTLLMGSDSHSERTLGRVTALLDGSPARLSLHRRRPFPRWRLGKTSKCTRRLSLPADLSRSTMCLPIRPSGREGVAQFWREFTVQHEAEELRRQRRARIWDRRLPYADGRYLVCAVDTAINSHTIFNSSMLDKACNSKMPRT